MSTNVISDAEKLTGQSTYSIWRWRLQSIFQREAVWGYVTCPPSDTYRKIISGATSEDDPVVIDNTTTSGDPGAKGTSSAAGPSKDTLKSAVGPSKTQILTDADLTAEITGRAKAFDILKRSITNSVALYILQAKEVSEAWAQLEKVYAAKSLSKRLVLRKRFSTLTMSPGTDVMVFLQEVQDIKNQLAEYGEIYPEDQIVEQVLNALPKTYEGFVRSVCGSDSSPSLEELTGKLMLEEDRRKRWDSSENDEALMIGYRAPDRGRGRSGYRGRYGFSRGRGRSPSEGRTSSPGGYFPSNPDGSGSPRGPCYRCGLYGHIQRYCQVDLESSKREGRVVLSIEYQSQSTSQTSTQGSGESKSSKTEGSKSSTTEATAFSVFSLEDNPSSWYLDSGASAHVTGDSRYSDQMSKVESGSTVRSAGGQCHNVTARGALIFDTPEGKIKVDDVLYVPSVKKNLLSIGSITDKGAVVVFQSDQCLVYKPENPRRILARGVREHSRGLYRLVQSKTIPVEAQQPSVQLLQEDKPDSVKTSAIHSARLWHRRTGHLSYGYLHRLSSKNLVTGLPNTLPVLSDICPCCQAGKSSCEHLPDHSEHRATEPLQLVHSDVWGPAPHKTLGGGRYFVSFIDDYSRKGWLYILSEKSQVYDTFRKFRAEVEKESGKPIKVLRSDRGGEYMSGDFLRYCEDHGIRRQLTTANKPAQNGVAEWRNRSLLEKARSMAHEANIPAYLWGETVSTANYLLNISPTTANPDTTPEERYSGIKPDVTRLRVFGARAYVHIGPRGRNKLESRAKVCILVGYDSRSKAYRCYSPTDRKILITNDVVFDEHLTNAEDIDQSDTVDMSLPSFEAAGDQTPTAAQGGQTTTDGDDVPPKEQTDQHTERFAGGTEPHLDDHQPLEIPATVGDDYIADETGETTQPAVQPSASVTIDRLGCILDGPGVLLDHLHASLPAGHKAITAKWIYKVKNAGEAGKPVYKARLVARGFQQTEGLDYLETFAPVVRWDTIRIVIALAASRQWALYHLDVKTAFLNGELEQPVYMQQPDGYIVKGKEHLVCKLQRALYGLRQAPRAWYTKVDAFLRSTGLQRSSADHNLYSLHEAGQTVLVLLYVDDLLVTGSHLPKIRWVISQLANRFEMSELGSLKNYLRIEFLQTPVGIFMTQQRFIDQLLAEVDMQHSKAVTTPMETGDPDQRKSTTGYVFNLGCCPVTWSSKKQTTVVCSSTEAEYKSLSEAAKESAWITALGKDLGLQVDGPTEIHCDNTAAMGIAANPIHHGRTKHVEVQFHYTREQLELGRITLSYVSSHENVADIFTKALPRASFLTLRKALCIYNKQEVMSTRTLLDLTGTEVLSQNGHRAMAADLLHDHNMLEPDDDQHESLPRPPTLWSSKQNSANPSSPYEETKDW
ncbi:hypothetical protein R1sor_018280 [Riccia sorocarpa]|uniref:Integrase catalytic domain-containing protein n=1 Tax=Riccia sorocarpa TaxID=122646 RepID=A0ABD3I985_9MARC